MRRLDLEVRMRIIELRQQGLSGQTIAQRLGVSRSVVYTYGKQEREHYAPKERQVAKDSQRQHSRDAARRLSPKASSGSCDAPEAAKHEDTPPQVAGERTLFTRLATIHANMDRLLNG